MRIRAPQAVLLLQKFIVEFIPQRLPYYHWTGVYMIDPDDPEMLILGPFRGAPTERVRIPVNQGIYGAAVAQSNTLIVAQNRSDADPWIDRTHDQLR